MCKIEILIVQADPAAYGRFVLLGGTAKQSRIADSLEGLFVKDGYQVLSEEVFAALQAENYYTVSSLGKLINKGEDVPEPAPTAPVVDKSEGKEPKKSLVSFKSNLTSSEVTVAKMRTF